VVVAVDGRLMGRCDDHAVTKTPQLRVLQLNVFARHGDWECRGDVLRAGLKSLQSDLLTLQEVVTEEDYDQVSICWGRPIMSCTRRAG
jgi:hypothetical protein